MAEFVQQSIERMLPELEEMERINLFKQHETRLILKKRKQHEYKMRRRTKQKEDYLHYIQYELNVLALVRKRRESSGIQFKKVEIDVAIVQRIHSLFRMVCHRFQDDVKLWLSHIEFAKKRGEKSTVSRLLLRMLQVHGRKPELWIMAAAWEFEMNRSTENARTLFQRGLRFNPESRSLWLEYYRMELLNADKLRKRRRILGLDGAEAEEGEETLVHEAVVLEGKVAEVVFRKAVDAFSDDVEFCLSFIPVCELFDFTKTQLTDMLNVLESRFCNREEFWVMKAIREDGPDRRIKQCEVKEVMRQDEKKAAVFEMACTKLDTEKMWRYYLDFWLNRIARKGSMKLNKMRTARCLHVFSAADEGGKLEPNMRHNWVNLLIKNGDMEGALHQSERATECNVTNSQLWMQRLSLLVESNYEEDGIVDLFKRAVQKSEVDGLLPLWDQMLTWCVAVQCRHLEDLLELGMRSRNEDVCVKCTSHRLGLMVKSHGIKQARKFFKRIVEVKPISKQVINEYITFELSQPSVKRVHIRRAHDVLVEEFGRTDPEVWLNYIKFELVEGRESDADDMTRASDLHWRALKNLDESITQTFVHNYTLLMARGRK